jgi:Fic family protein
VFAALCRRPLNSIGQLSSVCDLSFPTTAKALETLVQLGIAQEVAGGRRNRVLVYSDYLAILGEGAEPL